MEGKKKTAIIIKKEFSYIKGPLQKAVAQEHAKTFQIFVR